MHWADSSCVVRSVLRGSQLSPGLGPSLADPWASLKTHLHPAYFMNTIHLKIIKPGISLSLSCSNRSNIHAFHEANWRANLFLLLEREEGAKQMILLPPFCFVTHRVSGIKDKRFWEGKKIKTRQAKYFWGVQKRAMWFPQESSFQYF